MDAVLERLRLGRIAVTRAEGACNLVQLQEELVALVVNLADYTQGQAHEVEIVFDLKQLRQLAIAIPSLLKLLPPGPEPSRDDH